MTTLTSEIPWQASDDTFDEMWECYVQGNTESPLEWVPDMLCTMFAQQEKHVLAYHELAPVGRYVDPNKWGELERFDVQEDICKNAFDVIKELSEAVNQMGKRWKQTPSVIDREHFLEELADVWHFWVQLHIVAGVEPIDVFKAYFNKSNTNDKRRDDGY